MSKMNKEDNYNLIVYNEYQSTQYEITSFKNRPKAIFWVKSNGFHDLFKMKIIVQSKIQKIKEQLVQMKKPISRECKSPLTCQQVKILNHCKQEDYYHVGNLTFIKSRGMIGNILYLHRRRLINSIRGDSVHIETYCQNQFEPNFYKNTLPLSTNLKEAFLNFGGESNACIGEAMKAFSKRLSRCIQLQKLYISYYGQTEIEDKDILTLSEGLRYCHALEEFHIKLNQANTSNNAIIFLSNSLCKLKRLVKLSILNTSPYQETTDACINFLADSISQLLNLEMLEITTGWNCCRFGNNAYEYLFQILPKLKKLKSLSILMRSHFEKTDQKYINIIKESISKCVSLEHFTITFPVETSLTKKDRSLDLSLGLQNCLNLKSMNFALERLCLIKKCEALSLARTIKSLEKLVFLELKILNLEISSFPCLVNGISQCKDLMELCLEFELSQYKIDDYDKRKEFMGFAKKVPDEKYKYNASMISELFKIFKECNKIKKFHFKLQSLDEFSVDEEFLSNVGYLFGLCPNLEDLLFQIDIQISNINNSEEIVNKIIENLSKMDKLTKFYVQLKISGLSNKCTQLVDKMHSKIAKQAGMSPFKSKAGEFDLMLRKQMEEYNLINPSQSPESVGYNKFYNNIGSGGTGQFGTANII